VSDEQPLTAALFERMQSIAGRDLRELLGDQKQVTRHDAAQSGVLRHCTLQFTAADAQSRGWNLYEVVHQRAAEPVSGKKTQQAFGANRRDFDASPILHYFDKRDQAAVDEIGIFDRGASGINHLAGRKLDLIALAQQLVANFARQREKNAIGNFLVCATQHTAPKVEGTPTVARR